MSQTLQYLHGQEWEPAKSLAENSDEDIKQGGLFYLSIWIFGKKLWRLESPKS